MTHGLRFLVLPAAAAAAVLSCGRSPDAADVDANAAASGRDAALAPEAGDATTAAPSNAGNDASAGADGTPTPSEAGSPGTTAFAHPGCLSTTKDLDRMRAKVAAGAQPWTGSWEKLIANPHSQAGYAPNPQVSICAGSPCMPETFMTLANDAAAAYQLALRYRIAGDESYAAAAARVLDAWAVTLATFTGDSNAQLRAALYGYQLACAGELLRGYGGWDPSKLQELLAGVFYPIHSDFLQHHNGACDGNYWANWDLATVASVVAIGVFADRRDIFDAGINYFYAGAGEGSIGHAVMYLHPDGSGQWQESGRDQGHATLGPMLMGVIAEIGWNQGIDLYGYDADRFLTGSEYVGAYNVGDDALPFVAYTYYSGPQGSCQEWAQTAIASASRGVERPGWELIYNHYVNRVGLAAPFTAQYAAALRPEGGGGDYGSSSGGFDSLGFTTLTHTLDPIVAGAAPRSVRPFVQGHQVALSWSGSAYATGYRVKRARTSGGPYAALATLSTGATSYVDPGLTPGTSYFYVVSALGAGGETADSAEAAAVADGQLFGTAIGTSGSYASVGATKELALDGSLENFFDGPNSVSWVGLDLGAGVSAVVSEVKYAPRKSFSGRMMGGVFQGSNTADFSSGVTDLSTISVGPPEGVLTSQAVSVNQPFRYLRYMSASGGFGNTAEVEFLGTATGLGPPATPSGLTVSPSSGHGAALAWSAVPGADRYNLKRATAQGGPYAIVATGHSTSFADPAPSPSMPYFYVVSAVNEMGESPDSREVSFATGP